MSRNPFIDLGFLLEEAAALHIRCQLAAALEHHIDRKGWSQAESRVSNASQTRLSSRPRSESPDRSEPSQAIVMNSNDHIPIFHKRGVAPSLRLSAHDVTGQFE
jgi:hypothetical protein